MENGSTHELASAVDLSNRAGDKLQVTLWWVKGTLDTFVTVDDHRTKPPKHHFIEVPEGSSANDVFYHPFAYTETQRAA